MSLKEFLQKRLYFRGLAICAALAFSQVAVYAQEVSEDAEFVSDDDLKREERDAKYMQQLQVKQAEEMAKGQSALRQEQERSATAMRKLYEGLLQQQDKQTGNFTDPSAYADAVAGAEALEGKGAMVGGAATVANPSASAATMAPQTRKSGQNTGSEVARALDALAMEDGPEIARKRGLGFVPMGTIADVRLLTAVNTAIPGVVLGQLVYDLYDVDTRLVVIPRGSKLIGSCSQMSSDTEARGKVVFTTFVDPGGRVIPIATPVLAANRIGISGVDGQVDYHWAKMLGGSLALAVVSGISGGNSANAMNQNSNYSDMVRQNMAQSIGQSGQQLLQRFTRITPDITLEEGSITKIIFITNLMAKPYRYLASMPVGDAK